LKRLCVSFLVAVSGSTRSFGLPFVAFLIDSWAILAAALLLACKPAVISGVAFTQVFLNNQSLK